MSIWAILLHLHTAVWYPLRDDAIEHAQEILSQTVKLIDQLKSEGRSEEQGSYKNMDKNIRDKDGNLLT